MINHGDSTIQVADLAKDLVVYIYIERNVWLCKYLMLSGRHS